MMIVEKYKEKIKYFQLYSNIKKNFIQNFKILRSYHLQVYFHRNFLLSPHKSFFDSVFSNYSGIQDHTVELFKIIIMENNNGIIYGGDYGEDLNLPLDEGLGSLGALILRDLQIGGERPMLVSIFGIIFIF
jgi:hypothetical protein